MTRWMAPALAALALLLPGSSDLSRSAGATSSARTLSGVGAEASVGAVPRRARRLAFVPSDPLFAHQWYLAQDRAFDIWPDPPAGLPAVRVAVIDSGIDSGHPEFAGRIVAEKSFVGGTAVDKQGHGTFVAGEIAAALDNGQGIAGMAFPAELVIAKVVGPDGTISPVDEANAIRWAIAQHARVINLSLGGVRDPIDRRNDTFSPLEEDAIEYAYSHGAVIVAAVGNGDQAPSMPWPYASYPAALPHVIGVSALAKDGSVPDFSNRDSVYNDISAPGEDIFSTLPRALTAIHPTCVDQGYSDCGPPEFHPAEGTSFAAPQVSAAAALLLSVKPELTPDQVAALLEHSAVDMNASNGCRACPLLRDSFSGWGRLDVTAAMLQALSGPLPPPDRYEANDNAGVGAATVWGQSGRINATLDFWDDQIDVYRVRLRKGQSIAISLRGPVHTDTNLVLWKPGTRTVEGLSLQVQQNRVAQSAQQGAVQHIGYRAPSAGWYYVEAKLATQGFGPYTMRFVKS
jgi:subtilisin family serine protease